MQTGHRTGTARQGVAMFAACMKWRIESGVEDIFEKGEEGLQHQDGFLAQMTGGKTYLYGSDRYGRPVIYVNVALHKPSAQPAKSLEDFVLFQVRLFSLSYTCAPSHMPLSLTQCEFR